MSRIGAAEALVRIGRAVAETRDANRAARVVLETLRLAVPAPAAAIQRDDPVTGQIEIVVSAGAGGDVLPGMAGVAALATRGRGVVTTADWLADRRLDRPPDVRDRRAQATVRAFLGVPMLVEDRVMGALVVGRSAGETFSPDEIRLVEAVAVPLAASFEAARLRAEGEHARIEAYRLAILAGDINASLDIETILRHVGATAVEVCRADIAFIALREPGSDGLALRYSYGTRHGDYGDARIVPGRGIGGRVLTTGRPFRTDDYLHDPRITDDYAGIAHAEDVVAALVVPIWSGGVIEGLLYVERRSPRPFMNLDEAAAARLAVHAAIAIGNSRLLARERAALTEARQVATLLAEERHILEMVARSTPLGEVLDALCRAIERHVAGTVATILVVEVGTGRLRHGASPSLPEDYARAVDGVDPVPPSFPCAAAATRREPVVVEDLTADTEWAGAPDPALPLGFRACRATPILVADGTALGVLGLYSRAPGRPGDAEAEFLARAAQVAAIILQRERESQTRRHTEDRLAGIMSLAPDAIVMVDEAQRITLFNESAQHIFGYTQDEVLGRTLDLLLPARVAEAHRRHVADFAASAEISRRMGRRGEVTGRRKDGREFPAEASIVKMKHNGHTVYTAILCDVSERKQVQEALQRSEARARQVIRDAAYGIWRATPDGRVIEANPALAQILGYGSPEEMLGVDLGALWIDPAARDVAIAALQAAGTVAGLEVEWRRHDGRACVLRLSAKAVRDAGGAMEAIDAIAEDVTERRALEAELRQVQKVEAIGQLAGGIAHDFNNLLTVITGRAELLRARLAADHVSRRDVELIRTTTTRAIQLTRQLLMFSRRQALQPRVLDLNATVQGVIDMVRRLLGDRIETVCRFSPDLGHVRADVGQIDQIIVNLAVNARDAMPAGGRLTIETVDLALDAESARERGAPPGRWVTLSLTDTGEGMDAATRARLFEPFFTTKPPGKGTGLGLATVHGIVTRSGGFIDVASQPGHGSTFTIALPRVDEPVDDIEWPDRAPPEVARGQGTVLVVDDDPDVRALVCDALAGHGYFTLNAASVDEALATARASPLLIALVVSDVSMPKMTGPEMVAQLRSLQPAIRVLYISAVAHGGPWLTGEQLLAKPFSIDQLLQAVLKSLSTPPR